MVTKNFTDDNMLHVKKGKIEYLQFKILNKYSDELKHCITLRHGGVSKGPCESLNFRVLGKDPKENVLANLDIISDELGIKAKDVHKGRQAHTDNILTIDQKNKREFMFEDVSNELYDGYICKDKNIATLVTTADCNPIIMYDPVNKIYANVHSGWKGTIKKIYLKAFKKMCKDYGSTPEDIIVCVGPSIGKCCFSSEEESFKKQFLDVWPNEQEYIYYEEGNKKRFHIDLSYVIKKDLLELGAKESNLIFSNICTKCNADSFFSYRDSTMKKENDYGTMATIVQLY